MNARSGEVDPIELNIDPIESLRDLPARIRPPGRLPDIDPARLRFAERSVKPAINSQREELLHKLPASGLRESSRSLAFLFESMLEFDDRKEVARR